MCPTGRALPLSDPDEPRLSGRVVAGRRFAHLSVTVRGAEALPDLELEHLTAAAYRLLHRGLDAGPTRHAVRLWNFIPGIGDEAGGSLDRYMVFNAGRFAAFDDRYGGAERFSRCVPTASAVGTDGPDLVIHCLADGRPGTPVENPRQRAAYRYSQRYGPLPPCFARATRIETPGAAGDPSGGGRSLLIGGTSSVVGEASIHAGHVRAQAAETYVNLDAVIRAAGGQAGLASLRSLRIYHVRPGDAATLLADAADRVPHLAGRVEMVPTVLCRPDLLVEIEGVADVG